MKVVINACYGGFSLSMKAVKRLAELTGRDCFFFKTEFKYHKSYHIPIEMGEKSFLWLAYSVPDPDGHIGKLFPLDFYDYPVEERQKINQEWDKISIEIRDLERHSPLLIQIVEELGKEASGDCAELKIVEIPDGVNYLIEEYEGYEHVAEKHRTWG